MKRFLLSAIAALSCATAFAGTITLTGTVRDFNSDGVNFESNPYFSGTGYVASTLTGSSPTLTATGTSAGHISNTGAGAFDNWYTKTTDSLSYSITLTETGINTGLYQYSNNNFFPIDDQLLGNQSNSHNYHFTYAIASTFSYVAGTGQTFSFSGDDDVWVFFDKKLGIDLGGVHGSQTGTVNLDTLLNGYSSGDYSFDFFFAERHLTGSNLTITTSLVFRDPPIDVPEPSLIALLGLALTALGASRRRKHS